VIGTRQVDRRSPVCIAPSSHPNEIDLATRIGPEQPLLLTAGESAALCRVSVRTWRTWDAAGRVPRSLSIGRAKLWRPLELVDWVAAGCPVRAHWEWEPRVPSG
jgi:hypothetical protein